MFVLQVTPVLLNRAFPVANNIASNGNRRRTQETKPKELLRCSHCSMSFMSRSWLQKHMEKSHANIVENAVNEEFEMIGIEGAPMDIAGGDEEVIQLAQNQAQTLVEMQANITTVTKDLMQKVNYANVSQRSKAKSGPNKQLLRDKLKQQLKMQQELLKVQQEIFLKANQAQSDILQLIADLDGDEDRDEPLVEELLEPKEEQPPFVESVPVPYDPLINNPIDNAEIETDEIIPADADLVVMQGDGEDEEYELFEVIDDEAETHFPFENNEIADNDQVWFEVLDGASGENIKYRIVDQQPPIAKRPRVSRAAQNTNVRILNN